MSAASVAVPPQPDSAPKPRDFIPGSTPSDDQPPANSPASRSKSLRPLFDQLATAGTHLDSMLQDMQLSKEETESLLASQRFRSHRQLRTELLSQQLQLAAQDHAQYALQRLLDLSNSPHSAIARLAATQILAYAGLTPPAPDQPSFLKTLAPPPQPPSTSPPPSSSPKSPPTPSARAAPAPASPQPSSNPLRFPLTSILLALLILLPALLHRGITYNAQNQLAMRKVLGQYPAPMHIDWFGDSSESANWQKPGTGDAFDIASTNNPGLTVTAVAQDTINGTTEEEARAIVLWTPTIGSFQGYASITVPSTCTTGQVGYVFGYKSSNDYWIEVLDVSDNYLKIYHVVNGVKGSPVVNIAYWQDILHDHTATLQFSAQSAAVYWNNLANGFPSGQVGVYTTVANTQWTWLKVMPDQAFSNMAGRWDNYATSNVGDTWFGAIDPTTSTLHTSTYVGVPRPILLKNLSLGKFQATFSFAGTSGTPSNEISFAFNAAGPEDYSYIEIPHQNWADPVAGWQVIQGQPADQVSSTGTAPPSTTDTDIIWSRITFDGTTLTMKRLVNNSSTPTESDWSSATVNFTSTAFAGGGGRLGFVPTGTGALDNLTIQSWNGSSWTTEAIDNFTVDSSGYASDTPTYDNNGNLTYDGTQSYTYDAWNRLIKVSHAYRALTADGGDGNVHPGQVFETNTYDAAGRRIIKAILGTGPQDCTYHYYLSGNNIIEEQNGSAQTINQNVWGLEYIDELVQTSFNSDPADQSTCDTPYWVMQDANYNVLGVCDSSGILREHYEYSAYGQRQTFYSTGSNDPGCYAPTSLAQLCEFGFQGLMHDQPANLVYARARFLNTEFGRWNQNDPLGYINSMSRYLSHRGNPIRRLDPRGTASVDPSYSGGTTEYGPSEFEQMLDRPFTVGGNSEFTSSELGNAVDTAYADAEVGASAELGAIGGTVVGIPVAVYAGYAAHDSGLDNVLGDEEDHFADVLGDAFDRWFDELKRQGKIQDEKDAYQRLVDERLKRRQYDHDNRCPDDCEGYPMPTAPNPVRGWSTGQPINNLLSNGQKPSWPTVRYRYWRNEWDANQNTGKYKPANMARMQKGYPPIELDKETNKKSPMELHHTIPQRCGGLFDVVPVTPSEHAQLDPSRKLG